MSKFLKSYFPLLTALALSEALNDLPKEFRQKSNEKSCPYCQKIHTDSRGYCSKECFIAHKTITRKGNELKKACMSTVKDPENRNKKKTCVCGFHSRKAKNSKRNKKRRETLVQYAQRILKNTRESKNPDVIYWRTEIDKGNL